MGYHQTYHLARLGLWFGLGVNEGVGVGIGLGPSFIVRGSKWLKGRGCNTWTWTSTTEGTAAHAWSPAALV